MAADRLRWLNVGNYMICSIGNHSIFKARVDGGWRLDVNHGFVMLNQAFGNVHETIYATEEECEEAAKALAIQVALLG